MAQRSVIIKVVKGENPGDWHEKTTAFIDDNRDKILGDVIAALRGERFPLGNYSRWSTWESEVLCRLPEPGEAQKLILERQGEANCELEEAEIIEDFFASQLEMFGYCPTEDQIRIPVSTAAIWFAKAIGEPTKTTSASRKLGQMMGEGQMKRLTADASRRHGRNFIWRGEEADVFAGEVLNDFQSRLASHLGRSFYTA
jgi:hypothetical protein